MPIRKLGSATGTVTGVDGAGMAREGAVAWGEGDDEGLAAENEAADQDGTAADQADA